jgi:hypothetical protein
MPYLSSPQHWGRKTVDPITMSESATPAESSALESDIDRRLGARARIVELLHDPMLDLGDLLHIEDALLSMIEELRNERSLE